MTGTRHETPTAIGTPRDHEYDSHGTRAPVRVDEACWCPYAGQEVPECDGGPECGRWPG